MVKVEFDTFWQVSTGRGAGKFVDSLIAKDDEELPYVNGRTIRGLFRDTLEKLDDWEPLGENLSSLNTLALCGSRPDSVRRDKKDDGGLGFSSLRLSNDEIQAFKGSPELKSLLTTNLSSTAINVDTEVGIEKSLRSFEVAKPLRLHGEIEILDRLSHLNIEDIFSRLNIARYLILNVGAKKSRGYGQVKIELLLNKGAGL